ncbi:glycosyltransferase family 1 protein [Patescibacteria group bacterium]|nr:MAG: glycosyltransferase family 1 protein [Patescibacteria group bacterium]
MRVGIDIRSLGEDRKSGVGEYVVNLLEHLFQLDSKNEYILFYNSFSETNTNFSALLRFPNVSVKRSRFPNKLLNLSLWYLRWPHLDRLLGGVDVLFFPNLAFAAWSRQTKTVLTVHDLSFEYYPETFSWKRRAWHFFINPRSLCRRADQIVAVSDSTGSDIAREYDIDGKFIRVIRSAAASAIRPVSRNDANLVIVQSKYNLPYKFILFLGTVEPRKNIESVVRAYEQLRQEHQVELDRYKLVIAGAPGWKCAEIYQTIHDSAFANDILLTGPVAEEDKVYLLNLASLFVYPSLFEGFGFPPLEAMQAGVPVITSNNSSLPEVVGEAAVTIDPDRPDELYQAMRNILLDTQLQELLRARGLERAKKFSWEKAAREFLETVNKLAKV